MRPTATDGVAWSVGLYVTTVNFANRLNRSYDAVRDVDSGGPRNHALDGVQTPSCEEAF